MLLAQEWNDYSYHRKPLRVTSPVGVQRSTYRLQLPYRYSIPLLIVSGLLHWLVSQSIFIARVTTFDTTDMIDNSESISTCGYSPIAIITLLIFGFIICLLEAAVGFRRFRPGMPFVGSCSAAISAACHHPEEDYDAALKPIKWGAVGEEIPDEALGRVYGHCAFTSYEVKEPVEGHWYAGTDFAVATPI